MKVLADLHGAVEALQREGFRDWDAFARAAGTIQNAGFALYRATFAPGGRVPEAVEFIASSDTSVTEAYRELRIWRHNVIPETEMAPLEPVRRTDVIDEEEFARLGPIHDFMRCHGMDYQILVPAVLAENRMLGMFLWRDRAGGDFDDLEKQRLALFMRHLVAVSGSSRLGGGAGAADAGLREAVGRFAGHWALTPAESDILADLLEGLSLREIARRSGRSYGTVRWHVRNILEKCQVGSQRDLLREFYTLIRH